MCYKPITCLMTCQEGLTDLRSSLAHTHESQNQQLHEGDFASS